MRSIKLVIGLAAAAGAIAGGTAQADDPIRVCESRPGVYQGCTNVHTDRPCVDGGGRIADRSVYMFHPCH